jgi:hypothetical protein
MPQQGVARQEDGSGDAVAIGLHSLVGVLGLAANADGIAHSAMTQHEMRQLVHQGEDAPAGRVRRVEHDHGYSPLVEGEPAHFLQRDLAGLKHQYASRLQRGDPCVERDVVSGPLSLLRRADPDPCPRLLGGRLRVSVERRA